MLLAALAAAATLGAPPLKIPSQQALVLASWGRVVVRIDSDGFVQARSCNGGLRHVGDLAGPETVRIGADGEVAGLAYDPRLTPNQRAAFRRIMQAVAGAEPQGAGVACLPAETAVAGVSLRPPWPDRPAAPPAH